MTDNVTIDGAFLGQTGSTFTTLATDMPLRPTIVISNCGSGRVHQAMNGFNMWTAVTAMNGHHQLQDIGAELQLVAETFGNWDAQAASATEEDDV